MNPDTSNTSPHPTNSPNPAAAYDPTPPPNAADELTLPIIHGIVSDGDDNDGDDDYSGLADAISDAADDHDLSSSDNDDDDNDDSVDADTDNDDDDDLGQPNINPLLAVTFATGPFGTFINPFGGLFLQILPESSSPVFSPIEAPFSSIFFSKVITALRRNEILFHGSTYTEQPQSCILSVPYEILEHIATFSDLKTWFVTVSSCKQLLYMTLDSQTSIWYAFVKRCPLVSMISENKPLLDRLTHSFELLPMSLKPVQSVVSGSKVTTETMNDGCYKLLLGPDTRQLSWSQSIHSFQTERPWPLHAPDFVFGYYELTICSASQEYSAVGVGVASGDFYRYGQMVGWRANSYAYHSDDGGMYNQRNSWATDHFYLGNERARGKPNDIIGCGVLAATGQLFYTKNGQLLTRPPWKLPKVDPTTPTYHPTVSLLGCGDSATWNLGGKPFVFDIESFIKAELSKIKAQSAADSDQQTTP